MEYLSAPDFMDSYTEAKKQLHDIGIQIDQLNMQKNNASNGPASSYGSTWGKKEQEQLDSLTESWNTYDAVLQQCILDIDQYGAVIDETGAFSENYKQNLDNIAYGLDSVSQNTSKSKEETLTYEEAAAYAFNSVKEEVEKLCEAYAEAYQEAYDSFQGQFSLFDQASTNSEQYLSSTVANAQAALDTQLNYWTTYGQNIETLKEKSASDLKLTEEQYNALMSYVQSGSEEAAGLAASMVSELEKGNTDAVTKLGETLSNVNSKQDEIAKSVADWKTNFSSEMDAIIEKANNTVKDLDLSAEAKTAAFNTLSSYTAQLRASGGQAVAEAQSIANRISAALSSANAKINVNVSGKVPGHALGTTNAEDVFVAGENGPELVVGKAGSTVFPSSETNKIISALEGMGGTEYNRTSYATQTTSNSYSNSTNNYDRTVENFDQRETTEINNNYTTIENGSTYDDSRIVFLLDSFVALFSALEQKMNKQSEAAVPEIKVLDAYEKGTTKSDDTFIAGENGPELIVGQPDSIVFPTAETDRIIKAMAAYSSIEPYDFTGLEKSLRRRGGDVTNLDESVSYGDTYSVSNSVDRSYTSTVNYGDVVKSFEESINGGDSSYNTITSYDNERSYTAEAETNYGDKFDSEINYGDVIRNATEESNASNDKSYTSTVNYGDVVRSYIENIAGASEKRYNNSASASNSSEESYYSSIGDRSLTENTALTNTDGRYYAGDQNESSISSNNAYQIIEQAVRNVYSNSGANESFSTSTELNNAIRNYSNESNSNSVYKQLEDNSRRANAISYQSNSNSTDDGRTYLNYNNSSESVENGVQSVSNLSKATSLFNTSESHSDSVSVLSEAIRNNSSANNRYEQALTNLSNEYVANTNTTEQAAQSIENVVNGDTFNNSERNVERMEQSIANDNRAYEEISTSSDVSRADYYNTANTYGGSEYYDSRRTAEGNQSNDSRAFETVTSYGDSVKNFESSYINTQNNPETFENSSVSVFVPIIGIISAMLEKAFSDNLRAVETNYEAVYPADSTAETESTYSISIPELPEFTDSDSRVVAERGVERQNDSGSGETDGDRSGAGTETTKRIVLEIAGSGSIDISDGVDEEKVLELIEENMKPVLMNIIQSEIYEEGDMSYEF
jgi:hypothetical protein